MNRASWQSYDDVELLCLQIELGNRHTVMLIYPTNGDPPSVRLWEGSGEHPYGEDTLEFVPSMARRSRGPQTLMKTAPPAARIHRPRRASRQ